MAGAEASERRDWTALAIVAALALLAAVLLGPASARAVSPEEAAGLYNAQRQANGIPGLAALTPALVDGCAKHVAYMELNGLGHGEDPGAPGYTPEGAKQVPEASGNEVLGGGYLPWGVDRNPWEDAPAHLFLMFKPWVAKVGYAEDSYACMRMKDGPPDLSPGPHLYSYPGPGQAVFPELDASGELPFAPQDLVGLDGRATGPNLLLYASGLDPGADTAPVLRAVSSELVGPDGPVANRVVDGSVSAWGNVGGGVLVAVDPLRPFASYTARVTWRYGAGPTVEQVVPFRTRGHQNDMKMTLEPDDSERLVDITVRTAAPPGSYLETSIAPNLEVTLTGPGGRVLRPRWNDNQRGDFFAGSNTTSIVATDLARGAWQACAHSGGVAVGYEESAVCGSFAIHRPLQRPRIAVARKRLRVGHRRWLKVASVRCPAAAGRCRLSTPRRVIARLGRHRTRLAVRAPETVGEKRTGALALRVTAALHRALRGHDANLRIPVAVTSRAGRTARKVAVTLTR